MKYKEIFCRSSKSMMFLAFVLMIALLSVGAVLLLDLFLPRMLCIVLYVVALFCVIYWQMWRDDRKKQRVQSDIAGILSYHPDNLNVRLDMIDLLYDAESALVCTKASDGNYYIAYIVDDDEELETLRNLEDKEE